MIAPTPTTLRPLSSLLLALSSFPPDPIRDALEATVRHFSNRVTWATLTVATGVVLEAVEIIHDGVSRVKRKRREKRERAELNEVANIFPCGEMTASRESNSNEPKWVKLVLRLGLILVVVGVVGEWRCGAKLEDAHNAVHEYDLAKLTEANQKAGDAQTSANGAADAAARAQESANDADEKAKALGQYVGVVANSVNPRQIDRARFLQLMKGQPEATVEIWYDQFDPEVQTFVSDLNAAIGKGGLSWETKPKPFSAGTPEVMFIENTAARFGLAYTSKNWQGDPHDPLQVLRDAIELSLGGWGKGHAAIFGDPSLPDKTLVIAVGRYRVNVPAWIPPKTNQQKRAKATR
jgi:hypothetical protein